MSTGTGGALRQLDASELEAATVRAALSFGDIGDRADLAERLRGRVDRGELWGWDVGGEVRAHAVVTTVDHCIGAVPVACQNVAGVAVAPEDRSQGHAGAMMRSIVTQGVEAGLGLSLLFPATTAFYRRLGWEHAGDYLDWSAPTRALPLVGESMRPATDADRPGMIACADATARAGRAGVSIRPPARWDMVLADATPYVLDDPDGGIAAYLVMVHRRDPDDWQYRVELRDWAARSRRGLDAVIGFAARHTTIAKAVHFTDGPACAWATVMAEQDLQLDTRLWWMARPLDIAAALTHRQPATAVSGALHLAVSDPLVPGNTGPWHLSVEGGRSTVKPAPGVAADATLDVRGVGPLLTGFRSPHELARLGLAHGDDTALDILAAAYAGPAPHLRDFF